MPDLRQSPPVGLFAPTPTDAAPARSDAPQAKETALAGNLARASHPASSHEAAEDILHHIPLLNAWTVACVRQTPGRTRRELGAIHSPTDPDRIGRRLDGCVKAGLLCRGPDKECSISGKVVQTWWPAKGGGQ
jgi:hypothetical protein